MYAPRRRLLRRVLYGVGLATLFCSAPKHFQASPLSLGLTFLCVHYILGRGVWRPDHLHYSRVCIESFTDVECKIRFNFTRSELYRLLDALKFPPVFRDRYRCV